MAGKEAYETYAVSDRMRLKEDILVALQEDAERLNISSYNLTLEDSNEISAIYAEILNEHPELFYVEASYNFLVQTNSNKIVYIVFHYTTRSQEEKQQLAEKVKTATSFVKPYMKDEEKTLVLHDYLAQDCAYAYAEYLAGTLNDCEHVYNAYGALVNGKAVCQGYAEAYRVLLSAVGIDSEICASHYTMNHAWNVVRIDGSWYHVDVTWEDPVWNREGRSLHTYFLLSDDEMQNREHSDWTDNIECTSAKYDSEDYWWNSVNSQIVTDGKQYYVSSFPRTGVNEGGFQILEKDVMLLR